MIESWIIYTTVIAAVSAFFYSERKSPKIPMDSGGYGPKPQRYCDPMKSVHKRK